jgi:hypothetical protein
MGLKFKICKTGPRVDFRKTEGLLCKMAGNFGRDLIFQRINPWTDGSADRGGAGARRHAHRSSASSHSGAPKLIGGGTTERGAHGELG